MEKKCAHCGKIFRTEYPTKLYCSVECSKKAYLERDISGYDDLIDPAAEVYDGDDLFDIDKFI